MNERQALRRAEKRAFLDAYKQRRGCCDCGSKTNLQFDHRDKEAKRFKVGANVSMSWDAILAEIEKCDVRCGSCHTKRHHREEPGARAGRGVPKPRRKVPVPSEVSA